MKYFFLIAGLLMPSVLFAAENTAKKPGLPGKPAFTWDLLWAGSWEENKTLHNRGEFRLGLTPPGLFLRGQVIDRHTLNFKLDSPWGDLSKAVTDASVGLYHQATGSRLLYGTLDEWGLPARIRSPWIRSAPYTENHKPVMADMRTSVSSAKEPEAYLYLSSPRLGFFENTALPVTIRGFASGQFAAGGAVKNGGGFFPAFSGGLETVLGKNTELLLEGFYTGTKLPARGGSAWFSDPPPLPARDFRLGAAAVMLNVPYVSFTSDWAWSETFAWGGGIYGSMGIRINPPPLRNAEGKTKTAKGGPWSLSVAVDGMSDRYVGRDGSSPGGGLRTAGKIEWKGPRSSLFRINTSLRGSSIGESFERSASGIYYRFPTVRAGGGGFPLRVTRISLNADRNASDLKKIHDSVDAALGLSLRLPPMPMPRVLLPVSARNVKNIKPQSYPLGINLSASIDELGSAAEIPSPYPFFPAGMQFDSAKISGELLWSPGIFQLRTKWGYMVYAEKDNRWDGSISAAARFKYGRFSVKFAWPEFPNEWNCTLSWRVEK